MRQLGCRVLRPVMMDDGLLVVEAHLWLALCRFMRADLMINAHSVQSFGQCKYVKNP
jgi:hypothetical protein